MPAHDPSPSPPAPVLLKPLDVVELQHRAQVLWPLLREGAETRERDRVLPASHIRALGDQRLLTWPIPRTHGGSGASVRQVIPYS